MSKISRLIANDNLMGAANALKELGCDVSNEIIIIEKWENKSREFLSDNEREEMDKELYANSLITDNCVVSNLLRKAKAFE